jgi:hypothetical protein
MECQDGGPFDVSYLSIYLRGQNKLHWFPNKLRIITLLKSRYRIKFEGRAKKLCQFTLVYSSVIRVHENYRQY